METSEIRARLSAIESNQNKILYMLEQDMEEEYNSKEDEEEEKDGKTIKQKNFEE